MRQRIVLAVGTDNSTQDSHMGAETQTLEPLALFSRVYIKVSQGSSCSWELNPNALVWDTNVLTAKLNAYSLQVLTLIAFNKRKWANILETEEFL